MQYALIIREAAEDFARRSDPAYRDGWVAYSQALAQAGIMTGGAGLTGPETGTIVRRKGEDHDVQDGPYPDGKEQLGGFYLIDVPTWTPRSNGQSAFRSPTRVRSRCARACRCEAVMPPDARRAAEKVARQSYGKLIAFLAARSRDVPAAEDALSEALASAASRLAGARRSRQSGSLAAGGCPPQPHAGCPPPHRRGQCANDDIGRLRGGGGTHERGRQRRLSR